MTEKHPIGFTAFGTRPVCNQLFTAAAAFKIWSKTGGFIDIPEDEWMPIPLRLDATPRGARVYQLGPNDQKLIDKTFDLLHQQGKMEWSTKPT